MSAHAGTNSNYVYWCVVVKVRFINQAIMVHRPDQGSDVKFAQKVYCSVWYLLHRTTLTQHCAQRNGANGANTQRK